MVKLQVKTLTGKKFEIDVSLDITVRRRRGTGPHCRGQAERAAPGWREAAAGLRDGP